MQPIDVGWRELLLNKEPKIFEGIPGDRQLLYRKLVRASLLAPLTSQLSLTVKVAGAHRFGLWATQWLYQSPPKERIYWKLPVEFAMWFFEKAKEEERYFAELAHFEAMQLSCENASSSESPRFESGLRTDDRIEFDPTCRLCIYRYPVYLVTESDTELRSPSPDPQFIVLFRSYEKVRWLHLGPQLAQLLGQLAQGAQIRDAISFIKKLYENVDDKFLRSQLIKLNHMGILWSAPSCAEQ